MGTKALTRQPQTPAWRSLPVLVWVLTLTVLMMGPLARPGYALLRDMVATPRQFITPDAWGVGSAVPRAVPVDTVVSLASSVLGGGVVQRVALVAVVVVGGLGAARLSPGGRLAAAASATLMVWNAYVAQRLLMGHWALLLGLAALPWLVHAALRVRCGERRAMWALLAWLGLAALTPGGGLVSALTAGSVLLWPGGADGRWRSLTSVGGWLVLNAPWWVAGALHPAGGLSDATGVEVFAARADSRLGLYGSLLGLGGVWNADAVLPSRQSIATTVLVVLVVVLATIGLLPLRNAWGEGALGLAFASGMAVVLSSWATWSPASLEWVVTTVPGGGLLRDGQRLVAPLAVLLAVSAPLGLARLVRRVRDPSVRRALAAGLVIAPVAVMPDLAWGGWGRVQPVEYPPEWNEAVEVLLTDDAGGDIVSLPWQALRRFEWNAGRPVLDPAPRYLPRVVIASSDLAVRTTAGTAVVAGEDPRADAVARALASGEPLVDRLPELGVGWVVVATDTPGEVDPGLLNGAAPVAVSGTFELWRLPGPVVLSPPQPYWPVVLAANIGAAALVVVAVAKSSMTEGSARVRARHRRS